MSISTLPFDNHGQKVVVGQRATQGSPDIFLGWGRVDGRALLFVSARDMKGSASFVEGHEKGVAGFIEYCGLCGWALALAHAKSGDPAMIAGYCGSLGHPRRRHRQVRAGLRPQTDEDHEALDKARRSGRIRSLPRRW